MKKVLLIGTLFVLILALGLFFTAQYFLGSIAKAGVNKYGPSITQTKVELQDAKISPFSGEGTLSGIAVGNPQGWSSADAFRLGKVHLNVEPKSLFGDHIVINDLTIEQPEFVYETRLVASNIGDLLKNIEQSIGRTKDEAKTKDGKPIKLVVRKLLLKNGRVTVNVAGAASLVVPLPPIDMTDIGVAEGGVTPAQLAFAVMRNVTATVVGAATQALTKGGGANNAAAAVEGAKQIGDAIKGIFGGEKKKP
jgi:uncharacterized protein involved in outer membrane biogenesis